MLDYKDQSGKRWQITLGHADKRRAKLQRYEKQLELRVNVEPISMRLTDFFQDSLLRTTGQVRAVTLKETAKAMRDFTECAGDIDFARRIVDVAPKKDSVDTWEWHVKDTERRTLPSIDR